MKHFLHYEGKSGQPIGFFHEGIQKKIPAPSIQLSDEQTDKCVSGTCDFSVDTSTQTLVLKEKYTALPVLTTEQKLAGLEIEYAPRFRAIRDAYVTALMDGDQATAMGQVTAKKTLETEYAARQQEIREGKG